MMPPRNSTPPIGSRHSSPSTRGASRGGIQKRRSGPAKIDKDGDLIMDAAGSTEKKPSGKGRPEGNRLGVRGSGRTSHGSGSSRGTLGSSQTQQAILRGLGLQQANILESRISNVSRGDSGAKVRRRDVEASDVQLCVHGMKQSKAASNPDGGLKDLLAFLERKAGGLESAPRRGVRIKKSYVKEDDVFITVNQEDASMILKLNTFKFAGTALTIKALEESPSIHQGNVKEEANMSQEAKDIQERIRQILSIRYDVNLKLLNLSALGKDPGLVEMGMFDAQNRISKLFPVLMVVCDRLFTSVQQKQEAIVSVTLADNELDSISSVTSLAQTFPDIRNLDLSRNKFSDLRGLEGWRWRFRKLQNLKIIENPIENIVPDYKQDLAKWFPTLQILNEIQIRTPEEVAAATQAQVQAREQAKLSPIPIAGPDFRDVNQIGEGFVRQFLPLYDNDRISLLNRFYDQYSEHSISVNTSAPRSEQQPSAALSWAAYIKQSRNLFKVSSLNARISRLYRGSENIKRLWLELPPTRHPDLATQAHKYVVDCHSTPGLSDPTGQNLRGVDGLILMIHGEFEEPQEISPVAVLRGFSRTFVLGPGLSDISPIRVISDLLVLRAWSPLALNLADGVQAAGPNSEEKFKQQEIMNQLVHRTQMTPEYASMCLIETGWDLEKAFTAFEANRSKLPPTAFIRS